MPKLFELGRRYAPNFDFSNGVPLRPEFLDVVRGGWLLDKQSDRPEYDEIVSGIGYLFGLVLEDRFGMQWYFIEDSEGECISMIKFQDVPSLQHKEISIPPFNFVAKRKETQNVEVFCDGIAAFEKLMIKSRLYCISRQFVSACFPSRATAMLFIKAFEMMTSSEGDYAAKKILALCPRFLYVS